MWRRGTSLCESTARGMSAPGRRQSWWRRSCRGSKSEGDDRRCPREIQKVEMIRLACGFGDILPAVQSQRHLALVALTCLILHCSARGAEVLSLSSGRTHLRSGSVAEWEEFATRTPAGRRFDLRFDAQVNGSEATL